MKFILFVLSTIALPISAYKWTPSDPRYGSTPVNVPHAVYIDTASANEKQYVSAYKIYIDGKLVEGNQGIFDPELDKQEPKVNSQKEDTPKAPESKNEQPKSQTSSSFSKPTSKPTESKPVSKSAGTPENLGKVFESFKKNTSHSHHKTAKRSFAKVVLHRIHTSKKRASKHSSKMKKLSHKSAKHSKKRSRSHKNHRKHKSTKHYLHLPFLKASLKHTVSK